VGIAQLQTDGYIFNGRVMSGILYMNVEKKERIDPIKKNSINYI